MKFIAQEPAASEVETNVLTDGKGSCTYAALPEVFANLRARFEEGVVQQDACLAFECENTLPSALLLLFLLEEGHDFLLLPKPQRGCSAAPIEDLSFCAYRIAASPAVFTGFTASDSLELVPNVAYREPERADEPRLYVRTSGSTGTPKLAVHTHRGLRQNALNCIERFQLQSTDRVAIPVPLSHMYGLGAAFLPGAAVGASLDLQNGANVFGFIAREREFQPNLAFLTPTFCDSLLKGRRNSRPYQLTVTAGDRLRGDTFASYEARYGPMVQLYGSTEMGAVAASSPDDPAEARSQTVGKPLADVEVGLRPRPVPDGADGAPGETNDVGELWCRHTSGFCGYADENGVVRADARAVAGDWFPMKDLGRIGPDGRIQVQGRSDHAVKRSGLLVMFADIEASIRTVPGIDNAVVVASGESEYGVGLAAFCIPSNGTAIEAEEIRAACLERMPRREVPDAFMVVGDLPLLASGKIDRQALVRMAGVGTEPGSAGHEPSSLGV